MWTSWSAIFRPDSVIIFATSETPATPLRQRLLDRDQELPHRLDRGPLTRLDRLENLVGQPRGPINNARETSRRGAVPTGPEGLHDRLMFL